MASSVGITVQTWNKMEGGWIPFTVEGLDRFREATGFDLCVLAFCLNVDFNGLPGKLPDLLRELRDEWTRQLKVLGGVRHKLPGW